MKEVTFSFLSEKQLPQLHQTFIAAFADYVVPIQLSWEQFQAKVTREGITPSFCVAAFAGEQMVGFILTGLGEWQGKPTAYNAGTGVIPAFRGQHITQQLYQFLLPKLRESGVEQCLLEVIQENAPALKSYQHTGFHITRSLDCFRGLKNELLFQVPPPEAITIVEAAIPDWQAYAALQEVLPTWQNAPQAIKRSIDTTLILEAQTTGQELVGYAVLYPKNGAIAQLAVAEAYRRLGIGTALLRAMSSRTEAPALLLINVDAVAHDTISFLERRLFRTILKQYEMLLPL
ncbi:GNAT family N-acetyltransferase [Pontibacter chitinilyticus]|uniref:GNAT family N-acetyltransferase n=1 Tax=Pontibacter chitinilyticus TaxID=2674989 RepID=UPI00321B34BC